MFPPTIAKLSPMKGDTKYIVGLSAALVVPLPMPQAELEMIACMVAGPAAVEAAKSMAPDVITARLIAAATVTGACVLGASSTLVCVGVGSIVAVEVSGNTRECEVESCIVPFVLLRVVVGSPFSVGVALTVVDAVIVRLVVLLETLTDCVLVLV